MEDVGKKSGKAAMDLKKFAAEASGELGKLVPGMNAVGAAVRAMGAEFAVAGAAVAALTIGVKSVMALRDQYNVQRGEGMLLGISGARVEEIQRKFVRSSNGYVSRDAAIEGLRQFNDLTTGAYKDPTRLGTEARKAMMMGVNVGALGNPTSTMDRLAEFQQRLKAMSDAEAQGLAQTLGLSQDWVLALKHQAASIRDVTELTAAEIAKRKEAEAAVQNLNQQMSKLKEDFNELEIGLGQQVIPAMDKFVQWLTKLVDIFNKATKPSENTRPYKIVNGHRVNIGPDPDAQHEVTYKQGRYKIENGHRVNLPDIVPEQPHAAAKAAEDERKKTMEALDQRNEAGKKVADQMSLAINQFAASVGTFAGAITEQQAWAAWAGEIGKRNGLGGSSNAALPGTKAASGGARGLRNNNPGNLEYGDFAKAHGATGSDGRFAVFPDMATGAAAQRALLDQNYFGRGLNTPRAIVGKYAPASENNQGAYLAFLKSRGFDPDKAVTDKAGFSAAMMAYESGYGSGKGIGIGRSNLQANSVAQAIADNLHVPLLQIKQGGVNRGDVSFAITQLSHSLTNELIGKSNTLQAQQAAVRQGLLNPQVPNATMRELAQAAMNFQYLKQYSAAIEANAREGDRSVLTQNVRPVVSPNITINVNGAASPQDVAAEVQRQLTKAGNDLLEHYMTSEKG
ncbi:hypothetical protein [Trinickia symbiotica]|nr:hypothetical protein [Trinickia symbiotica]